jgi:hypothetical protein
LLSVILALKTVPVYKSLQISTRSEYMIHLIVHYAARNEACGWRCVNGDLLKLIFAFIKVRSVLLHLCHLPPPARSQNGHLILAVEGARKACDLPRAQRPLDEPQDSNAIPEQRHHILDVLKVTTELPNNSGPDEPSKKPACTKFPLPHEAGTSWQP